MYGNCFKIKSELLSGVMYVFVSSAATKAALEGVAYWKVGQ